MDHLMKSLGGTTARAHFTDEATEALKGYRSCQSRTRYQSFKPESVWPVPAPPSFLSPMATGQSGFEVTSQDVLGCLTLDEAPRRREQVRAGDVARLQLFPRVPWARVPPLPLGSGWQPGPRPPGTGCVGRFRRRPLGSSGHTGPSGCSSDGLHSASLRAAASSIRNWCVFCREAGPWPSRGDNGLSPLKRVSLHPPPPLSSLGEDFFLPRPKSHSLGPLPNP